MKYIIEIIIKKQRCENAYIKITKILMVGKHKGYVNIKFFKKY